MKSRGNPINEELFFNKVLEGVFVCILKRDSLELKLQREHFINEL